MATIKGQIPGAGGLSSVICLPDTRPKLAFISHNSGFFWEMVCQGSGKVEVSDPEEGWNQTEGHESKAKS